VGNAGYHNLFKTNCSKSCINMKEILKLEDNKSLIDSWIENLNDYDSITIKISLLCSVLLCSVLYT
jgi:hypothetical protein